MLLCSKPFLVRFCYIISYTATACIFYFQGNLGLVQDLLQQGLNPNVRDNAGWTPLVCVLWTAHILTRACLKQAYTMINILQYLEGFGNLIDELVYITKYSSTLYIGMDGVFQHYAHTIEKFNLNTHFQCEFSSVATEW